MKYILGVLLLFPAFASANAQTATNLLLGDSTDIYQQSFRQYCNFVEASYSDVKVIYVESSRFFTTNLPKYINGIEVKIVHDFSKIKKMIKNGTPYLLRIVPLINDSSGFFINMIPFKVEIEKGSIIMTNQGVISAHFKYDCLNGEFEYDYLSGGVNELK